MRKIRLPAISVFLLLLLVVLVLAIGTTKHLFGALPLGDFRGVALVAATIVFVYLYAIAVYRAFLHFMPLPEGEIAENSREEFGYHVYTLFYLMLFFPLTRSGSFPVPLTRPLYIALGARLGENTYSSGIIMDPPKVEIGAYTIVGQSALLTPHVMEGKHIAHHTIRIGNNVTIGAHAVILAGVSIGDNAIVASGAVVPKGTQIGCNEVWGGVPARLLRRRENNE